MHASSSTRRPLGSAVLAMLITAGVTPQLAAATPVGSEHAPPSAPLARSGRILSSVSADAPDDAWSVGARFVKGSVGYRPLIEHFDGAAWTRTNGARAGDFSYLHSVVAFDPQDAWAVGSSADQTLAEHWDGSHWTRVSTADNSGLDDLWSVTGSAPGDVWAVGLSDATGPLIEHWDGGTWSIATSPIMHSSYLLGASADATDDAWAVGFGGPIKSLRGVILHWNGSAWSSVRSPLSSLRDVQLFGVDAIARDDVWIVGAASTGPIALHWDGQTWTLASTPDPKRVGLFSVSGDSPSDVWAVGARSDRPGHGSDAVIEHWDGTAWSIVPGLGHGWLNGVSTSSGSAALAVGNTKTGGAGNELLERWDGASWQRVH